MIKMLTACTAQIDDPEDAAAEILRQLDLDNRKLKNSVGIIACYNEYIDTGVVKAVCAALPFDVVGCTTLGNAARGECGLELLSVSVLTSDDVSFAAVYSGKLGPENLEKPIADAYEAACEGKKPDFILSYLPIMNAIGGSALYNAVNSICAGIPLFGAIACDHSLDFSASYVICNGDAAQDRMALILMFGPVNPRFFVTSLPGRDIQKQRGLITESEGVILKRINNMPVLDYLTGLGLTRGGIAAMGTIPLIVNYNDGAKPVALGMYSINAEGYAVCGGEVPVNATVAIGTMTYSGIMETAGATILKALELKGINGILMYPCLTRNLLLGANSDDEMKRIGAMIGSVGSGIPYQICYAAGEICPLPGTLAGAEGRGSPPDGDEKLVNHFHNYTFTLCAF
jgi:hypothetical protein